MSTWEDFEIDCTRYLNQRFGAYARFIHQGGSDSTVPDIFVQTATGNTFYIDVKHCPAQCGQFVLLPNIESRTFEYSNLNVNHLNSYAQLIMQHMNHSFDAYCDAGTGGKDIDMNHGNHIFSNWIIQTYQEKGAKFFITNHFTLLPLERFQQYFNVTAKYRIKRSGSGNVGKNRISSVKDFIKNSGYVIENFRTNGDKLFVKSPQNLHNKRFILNGTEYMFSLRSNEYELRKLSNTYNANVIFSIKNNNTPGISDAEFIDALK